MDASGAVVIEILAAGSTSGRAKSDNGILTLKSYDASLGSRQINIESLNPKIVPISRCSKVSKNDNRRPPLDRKNLTTNLERTLRLAYFADPHRFIQRLTGA